MKKYHVQNYIRYKNDVKASIERLPMLPLDEYTREELTIKFLPLVENIARKFSTSQQASGVMSIMDMIQSGSLGLAHACRKLDYNKLKESEDMVYQIPDNSEPYNIDLLNIYLKGLCQAHLSDREYQVLRLSYGLDCEKHTATEIAKHLNIEGSSSYVRVSQLKKQAVDTLIENVDHSQVLDYL